MKNITTEFGVISIAGLYRTGKSYLLNKIILNRDEGFKVGETVNPCTKGLWIFSKPMMGINSQGETMPIYVIDSEGIGSFEQDKNHDTRICTLSVLLSSLFIYNSCGVIDEDAIDNLYLMVNYCNVILNKNQDMSDLFPNLLWVLRDFGLQLIENDTPSDYLERALATTTYSKSKDTIKRFFTERSCFAMVRPVTNEKDLQNLPQLSENKLRKEFLQQIITLRKLIISKCKAKSICGQSIMSGSHYYSMVKSYIESFNDGTVPVISSTWSLLCKVENEKVIEKSVEEYERYFKQKVLDNNFKAFDEQSMINIHNECKENAKICFNSKAIGDEKEKAYATKQLKKNIKEKFRYFSKLNDEEIRNDMYKILKRCFEIIEYKIKSNELATIPEVEEEISKIEGNLQETYSVGTTESVMLTQTFSSMRNYMLLDFKFRILLFASTFFLSKYQEEIGFSEELKTAIVMKNQTEIADLKQSMEKEIRKKETAVEELKEEVQALKNELIETKEQTKIKDTEYDQSIKKYASDIQNMKGEYEREISKLKEKLIALEDKEKESERKCIRTEGNFEKEKALYEQKIENLNKLIEECNSREKNYGNDLRMQMKEQSQAMKDAASRYEKIIKDLSIQIDGLKEKSVEMEANLQTKEHLLEMEKIQTEEQRFKFTKERNEINDKLNSLRSKYDTEKAKYTEQIQMKDSMINQLQLRLNSNEEELMNKNKLDQAQLLNQLSKLEREYLTEKQNNGFLEEKCNDLTFRLQEMKKNQDKVMELLDKKPSTDIPSMDEYNKKVEEIQSYFLKEKQQMEYAYEKEKELLYKDNELMENKIRALNKTIEEFEKEISEKGLSIAQNEKKIVKLENEKEKRESLMLSSTNDFYMKMKQMNEEIEKQIESKEQYYQNEIKQITKNAEETLSQVKSMFNLEKVRLEEKIKEEKISHEKEINQINEEWEEKLKELEKENRMEYDNLQDLYSSLESTHQKLLIDAEHEIGLLNQKIESLETSLKENKESALASGKEYSALLERKTSAFNSERKELIARIEGMIAECNNKEKNLAAITLKKEMTEKILKEKEDQFRKEKAELERDIKELRAKLESYKAKQQELVDEFVIKKLEFSRENSLLKQQIDFVNKQLEEQTKLFEDNERTHEENLLSLKNEIEGHLNLKFEILLKEKNDLNEKYNKKNKELRDLEQTFLKQTCLNEKEKNNLNSKISALEKQNNEIIETFQDEMEKIQKFSEKAKYVAQNEDKLREELILSKKSNDQLSKQLKDIQAILNESIEKKTILEEKVKLLEKQREDLKSANSEYQNKLEILVETFEKKYSTEKERLESYYEDRLNEIETRYKDYIKEQEDHHRQLYSDMIRENEDLEGELKKLSLQAELRDKNVADPVMINKKINELIEIQEHFKSEAEESKREKEKCMTEYKNYMEKDKESWRNKIYDMESKLKDYEAKRAMQTLEYEKERVRWGIERENLNSMILSLKDQIDFFKMQTALPQNQAMSASTSETQASHKRYSSQYLNNIETSTEKEEGSSKEKEKQQGEKKITYNSKKAMPYHSVITHTSVRSSNYKTAENCHNLPGDEDSNSSNCNNSSTYDKYDAFFNDKISRRYFKSSQNK